MMAHHVVPHHMVTHRIMIHHFMTSPFAIAHHVLVAAHFVLIEVGITSRFCCCSPADCGNGYGGNKSGERCHCFNFPALGLPQLHDVPLSSPLIKAAGRTLGP